MALACFLLILLKYEYEEAIFHPSFGVVPARNKFIFSEADNRMEDFLELRTLVVLFPFYKTTIRGKNTHYHSIRPEDSADGLASFLYYKAKDQTVPLNKRKE